MGVLAIVSAPLTIAADAPEEKIIRYVTTASGETQSYEILTEDGERRAYKLLNNGERETAKIVSNADGTFRLIGTNGQSVVLPKIDLDKLENLKSLEGLRGLEALTALNGLEGLVGDTGGLNELTKSGVLDLSKAKFRVYNIDDSDRVVSIPTMIVDGKETGMNVKVLFEEGGQSLASAKRQLDRTQKQLEALAKNENLSFDLENALRDIQSARKSLEAAENRLLDEAE